MQMLGQQVSQERNEQANQNLRAGLFAKAPGYPPLGQVIIQVSATPIAIPPKASWRKVKKASDNTKLPVSTAAMANRRQTSPDASLSSDSLLKDVHQALWHGYSSSNSRYCYRIGW